MMNAKEERQDFGEYFCETHITKEGERIELDEYLKTRDLCRTVCVQCNPDFELSDKNLYETCHEHDREVPDPFLNFKRKSYLPKENKLDKEAERIRERMNREKLVKACLTRAERRILKRAKLTNHKMKSKFSSR